MNLSLLEYQLRMLLAGTAGVAVDVMVPAGWGMVLVGERR